MRRCPRPLQGEVMGCETVRCVGVCVGCCVRCGAGTETAVCRSALSGICITELLAEIYGDGASFSRLAAPVDPRGGHRGRFHLLIVPIVIFRGGCACCLRLEPRRRVWLVVLRLRESYCINSISF